MWSDFACYSCGNSTVSFLVTTGASSRFKGKVCNVKITCIQWLDSITVYFVNCKWVHVEVGVVPWCSTDFHCSHHGLCLYNFLSMWRVLEWGINTYLKRNQKKKYMSNFLFMSTILLINITLYEILVVEKIFISGFFTQNYWISTNIFARVLSYISAPLHSNYCL